jgi:hypothetical protein
MLDFVALMIAVVLLAAHVLVLVSSILNFLFQR